MECQLLSKGKINVLVKFENHMGETFIKGMQDFGKLGGKKWNFNGESGSCFCLEKF